MAHHLARVTAFQAVVKYVQHHTEKLQIFDNYDHRIKNTIDQAARIQKPFHRLPVNHQIVFNPGIVANTPNIPTTIVHSNIGLSLNHQILSDPA